MALADPLADGRLVGGRGGPRLPLDLLGREPGGDIVVERAVHEHAERGDTLAWLLVGFAVVVVLGAWALSGTTALASGKGAWESRMPALERIMPVALVLAAVAVLVMVVLVGDSGARAVWAGRA